MKELINGTIEIFTELGDLFKIIINGINDFVKFILDIPTFIKSLINIIPSPFDTIISAFLVLIIFLIVVFACSRLISSVKGG